MVINVEEAVTAAPTRTVLLAGVPNFIFGPTDYAQKKAPAQAGA
jgi:hypothetical protein